MVKALGALADHGEVRSQVVTTGGRPSECSWPTTLPATVHRLSPENDGSSERTNLSPQRRTLHRQQIVRSLATGTKVRAPSRVLTCLCSFVRKSRLEATAVNVCGRNAARHRSRSPRRGRSPQRGPMPLDRQKHPTDPGHHHHSMEAVPPLSLPPLTRPVDLPHCGQ